MADNRSRSSQFGGALQYETDFVVADPHIVYYDAVMHSPWNHNSGGHLPQREDWSTYRYTVKDIILGIATHRFNKNTRRLEIRAYFVGEHPLFKELVAMGPEGIKLLGAMLKTGDQSERFGAAALMEKLMSADAVPHLEAAIFGGDNDDNVLVQRMASHALGKIGGETAIPVLERVVAEGSEWGVRTNAAYSLAEMGRSSGIDWLLENYASQDDAGAKMAILGAMGQIGDPSYLPTLHTVLKEETEYSKRYLAVTGIAKAARAESLPVLEAIINNPDEDKMIITEAQKAYDEIKTEE